MVLRWENPDGSTNVDGFLAAYAQDDNTFWRAEIGHVMNVLDEVIDRLEAALTREEEAIHTSIAQQNAGAALVRAYQAKVLQEQVDVKQAEDLLQWVLKDRPSAHSDRLWEAINRFLRRKELHRGKEGQ